MANQACLADNASAFARRAKALAGLVVCGHCGRQRRATYKPQPRDVCHALTTTYGGPGCLHLEGASVEAAVVAAFFEALRPAELDLLDEVLAAQQADEARLARQYADQVKRTEYAVRLVEKQYRAVDPDNRFVAAALERRWEQALRAVGEAREAAECAAQAASAALLDSALRAQLRDLGPRRPEL